MLKKIGIPLNKGRVASLLPIYKELFDDIAEEYELLPPTTQAAQNFAVIADVIEEEMEMANVPGISIFMYWYYSNDLADIMCYIFEISLMW